MLGDNISDAVILPIFVNAERLHIHIISFGLFATGISPPAMHPFTTVNSLELGSVNDRRSPVCYSSPRHGQQLEIGGPLATDVFPSATHLLATVHKLKLGGR